MNITTLKEALKITEDLRDIEDEILFLKSHKTTFGLTHYGCFDDDCLNKHLVSKRIEVHVIPEYLKWLLENKEKLEKELKQL